MKSNRWADYLKGIDNSWSRKVTSSSTTQQFTMNAKSWITASQQSYKALEAELGFGNAASNCQIRRR